MIAWCLLSSVTVFCIFTARTKNITDALVAISQKLQKEGTLSSFSLSLPSSKTNHLSYPMYKHDIIDITNLRSMQDACCMKFEDLSFDSSWRIRIFSLTHARDKTKKKNFLTKKKMLFISLWKVRKEIAYFAPWCSTARIQRPWSLVDRLIHWVYNHFILLLCITRTNNNESVVWVNWSTTRKGARVYFPHSGWLSNL